MDGDGGGPSYACRCLNIRLYARRTQEQEGSAALRSSTSEFEPLFVSEDGIEVVSLPYIFFFNAPSTDVGRHRQVHNELTLRIRSPVTPDPSSSGAHTQLTSVACLVCNTVAYRVKADLTHDTDAKEGPVLPTEDWAEHDMLKSRSGWVEVHNAPAGCIVSLAFELFQSSAKRGQSPYWPVLPLGDVVRRVCGRHEASLRRRN